MTPFSSGLARSARISVFAIAAACGGGGGGTPPGPTVATVVITSTVPVPSLVSLGATVQLAAQPRDASGNPVSGATLTWSSSNNGVAAVSGSGLVTAIGNGTANITATSSSIPSTAVAVTVAQSPATVVITPGSVTFGAIGSTKQLAAVVNDAGGSAIAGAAVAWTRNGPGTRATVSATGLVTATGVGLGDSAVATSGAILAKAPITVNQLTASILVSSTQVPPDTLFTTGRTRQFSASARDSNNNVLATQPTFTWSINGGGVAVVTVDATGLVTAGSTTGSRGVRADVGAVNGLRAMVVRHYPETFTVLPASASITTSAGTQAFTGTSLDSSGSPLFVNWVSRSTSILTVSPANTASGANTTATAVADGVTYLIMSTNARSDSAQVTITGQPAVVTFSGNVMPILTTNCAKAGCHVAPAPTGGMDLTGTAATVRSRLVGVATVGGPPGSIRVIAGDANTSYIIRKLEGGPNINGGQMPADGPPFLPQATIDVIRNWITQGALNN